MKKQTLDNNKEELGEGLLNNKKPKKYIVRSIALYLYLHEKIWREANFFGQIKSVQAEDVIGRQHNLPIPIRPLVLKEMSNLGLLMWINRDQIQLKQKPKEPIMESLSPHFEAAGCY